MRGNQALRLLALVVLGTLGPATASARVEAPSYNYCSSISSPESHLNWVIEASSAVGWTPSRVAIVNRHGDRAPLAKIPWPGHPARAAKQPLWDCGLHTTEKASSVAADSTAPLFRSLQRGADRNLCFSGQLTSKGANQLRELGRILGRRYEELLVQYQEEKVYGRHTNTAEGRTRLSLEMLLTGMLARDHETWPGGAVPIEYYPGDNDYLWGGLDGRACPGYERRRDAARVEFNKVWRSELEALQKKFSSFDIPDEIVFGVDTVEKFMDWLQTISCHGGELPCADSGAVCVTEEDVMTVTRMAGWWAGLKFDPPKDDGHRELYRGLTSGALLYEMASRFEARQAPTISVFSAHDSTVSGLLASIQLTEESYVWPPYASHVVFELGTTRDGPDSPKVFVHYNGKPMALPCCNGETFCPLGVFVRCAETLSGHGKIREYSDAVAVCNADLMERLGSLRGR